MEKLWKERCSKCHHATREARIVPELYQWPLCGVCEGRIRNGLIHYRPSNGSEFEYFYHRCCSCRHFIDDSADPLPGKLMPPFTACTWGVLDRLHVSMVEDCEHISNWFDPKDIEDGCPATCLRYTHKNDPDGETRDPPPPVDPAQMTFGDLLTVVERVPEVQHAGR